MGKLLQGAVLIVVFALAGVYGFVELRGPQGIPALKERWTEIRKLEEENANLQRENNYRRDRIKRLEESSSEQELEIRKQLKLLRPGETTFILPEGSKQSTDQQADPQPQSK
jgi:cell division protein FtsB